MTITRSLWIEEIIEMELFSWSHMRLVLDMNDLVGVERILDDREIVRRDLGDINVAKFNSKVYLRVAGQFEGMNSDFACNSHDVRSCVCFRLGGEMHSRQPFNIQV